jgi:hypothetical protein
MVKSLQISAVMVLLLLHKSVSGRIYCANHNYESAHDSGHMQFTKEVVAEDYVSMGDFKSLHCCAKGYRSIEW